MAILMRICTCAGCGVVNDCTLVRDAWYCAECLAAMGTTELPAPSVPQDSGSGEPSVEADFYPVEE